MVKVEVKVKVKVEVEVLESPNKFLPLTALGGFQPPTMLPVRYGGKMPPDATATISALTFAEPRFKILLSLGGLPSDCLWWL